MMIGNDQFESELASERRFTDTCDAAVNGDDEHSRVVGVEPPQGLAVQSISLLQPAGDVVFNLSTHELQAVPKKARRRDAIDVVIAVDGDSTPALHGRDDPVRS